MPMDEDTLELLERRMAERVEKRVRSRLFTIYGLIGGGVLAALGWFGYDVVETFRDTARDTAKTAAAAAVSGAVEDAEAAAAAAATAAERATAEAVKAQAKLQALEDWRAEGQSRLNLTLERVNDATTSINQSLADIQARLEEADKRVARVKAEGEATYLGSDYAEVVQNLADEVARLDEQLAQLMTVAGLDIAMAAGTGDAGEDTGAEILLPPPPDSLSVAQMIRENVETLNAPTGGATIFAQFPYTRANVAPISDGLKALGYDMPPWENLDTARGLSEIRYFYEADAELAQSAAEAVNGVLARLGWTAEVEAKLIDYIKVKPKRGVLELWLDPTRS